MNFGLGTRGGFVIVVLAGVVVPGLTNYFLSSAGFDILGSTFWALGYGTMAVVLWYGWVRPLDLSGPQGVRDSISEGTEVNTEPDPETETN